MGDLRSRNRGIVPLAIKPAIADKGVGVAGTGGAGGSFIEPFIRQCGVRFVKVADLDTYDPSNRNRQVGAFESTLGKPKVEVVAGLVRDIDPSVRVEEFPRGIQPDLAALDEFLDGVALVVDAVDFKHPDIHMALTRRARQRGIPVIMGIETAYGARAVWFSPTGMTFERFFRLGATDTALSLRRMIMRMPTYVDLNAFKAVQDGTMEAPAIATGGSNLAALLVPMVEAILSGVDVPPPAPVGYYADTKAGRPKAGRIRHHQLAWWGSVAQVLFRDKVLHLNHATV